MSPEFTSQGLMVECDECSETLPAWLAINLDVSDPDAYYPTYEHYCPGCDPDVREVV